MPVNKTILITLFLLGACSVEKPLFEEQFSNNSSSPVNECMALFSATEQIISAAGVVDTQAHRLPDYPYLRVNRFLSSYRNEINSEQFENWLEQLQRLGLKGWKAELHNLSLKSGNQLQNLAISTFRQSSVLNALETCGNILRRKVLNDPVEQQVIRNQATVPSEYQIWKQIAGFYPLTAIAFRLGIYSWHEDTLQIFKLPLNALQVSGQLLRYGPRLSSLRLNQKEVADILKRSSANRLKIPLPHPDQQNRLFESFAPIFEIDIKTDSDKIGSPILNYAEIPQIDTSRPVVYQHLSHTRLGTEVLLQLNYSIWFPSRPKLSVFDLLGGQLDGIIWRVTLSADGSPIMFDSIHHCGCYHLFFPTQNSSMESKNNVIDEPAFTPQPSFNFIHDQSVVIRIASNSHYLQRIYLTPDPDIQQYYKWDDYDSLRSLPLANGIHQSLFGNDGIVAGSERGERYLFWPMGIPEPGAMRQWGHHATAFVGRRHFDEPRLLENSFKTSSATE